MHWLDPGVNQITHAAMRLVNLPWSLPNVWQSPTQRGTNKASIAQTHAPSVMMRFFFHTLWAPNCKQTFTAVDQEAFH